MEELKKELASLVGDAMLEGSADMKPFYDFADKIYAQAIDDAVGCVPPRNDGKAQMNILVGIIMGFNDCREQTLQALSALQK